jgi:hypothetical protein
MAAGDLWPTLRFREMIMDGTVSFKWSATIHWVLAKASLTAYVDNSHLADLGFLGSVTAEVCEVDGGDQGGLIPSLSITLSSSFVLLKGGPVTFSSTAGGGTARFALLVHNTGTEATSPIIGILDLGSARALTGATNSTPLTISFTDNKILKFSGTGTPALT